MILSSVFPHHTSHVLPWRTALTMTKDRGLVLVSTVAICSGVYSAVVAGLSWSTLLGDAECDGSMHKYFEVAALTSVSRLGAIGLGMLLLLLGIRAPVFTPCSWCVLIVVLLASSFISIGYFIWGVILLANNDSCRGTVYYDLGIALVILYGLGFVGGAGARKAGSI